MTLQDSTKLERTNKQELMAIGREAKSNVKWVVGFTAFLWLLEIFDLLIMRGGLDRFGIRPRSFDGLVGIATAPFLHGGMGHLIGNTFPFVILGGLIMFRGKKEWAFVSVVSALFAGTSVWLLGAANSNHIGASAVIFGYFGYLLSLGWFERKWSSILMSLVICLGYGTMIFSVFPGLAGPGVSWEGHLFGFLGGILSARLVFGQTRKKNKLLEA